MRILTSSSLSVFRDCPRKYHFQYRMGRVRLTEARALAFGKITHGALECWWRDGPESAAVWLVEHADEIEPDDAARIVALLSRYAPPRDDYEILGVEVPFEMKVKNPGGGQAFRNYRLSGKVDLLLKHKGTGETWICDHKTTSQEIEGWGPYWQGLYIDGQMGNYCLAFDAVGFIFDAIRKPTIKLCGKDEKAGKEAGISAVDAYQKRIESDINDRPEHYYQWREFAKTREDSEAYAYDLWQQLEMFRACDKNSRFPRNCNACVGRYGTCAYLDVCTNRADLDDDALFRSKEAEHEELSIPV